MNEIPHQKFEELKAEIITRIAEIDKITVGNENMVEPGWWLDMTNLKCVVLSFDSKNK